MYKLLLAVVLGLSLQAATQAPTVSIDKDSQIKLLRGWKDWQGDALELKSLEEQYKALQAKQTKAQADVLQACADAVKLAGLDPDKKTCDIDKMVFVDKPGQPVAIPPTPAEKPTAQ